MNTILLALGLSASSVSAADPTSVAELKAFFAQHQALYDREFAKAAGLNPITPAVGREITREQCKEVEARVVAQYKISPLSLVYEGGNTQNPFCELMAADKFYLQDVTTTNQFGLPVKRIIQVRMNWVDATFQQWSLGPDDSIVEVAAGTLTGEQTIISLDRDGNTYRRMGLDPKKPNKKYDHYWFALADGTVPPSYRSVQPRRADRGKDTVSVQYLSFAPIKDWKEFNLIITHAWSSGFYDYGGKIYRDASNVNHLSVYSVGGKEVCAEGWVTRDRQNVRIAPVGDAYLGSCFNNY